MGDYVVGVGDEGGAHGAHVLASSHLFLLPYAKCLIDLGGGVGEEDEGEGVLVGKLDVAGCGVLADADYLVAQSLELFVVVTYGASLSGAAGGIVLGIEVDDERFAGEIRCLHCLSVTVDTEHFGYFISDIHIELRINDYTMS